jgi:thermitase
MRTVMKKIWLFLVVAVALFAGPPRVVQTQDTQPRFVADEILIQFRQGATAGDRADARKWVSGARQRLIRRNGTGELELASTRGWSVKEAAALLRIHPAVEYAEPNWIYTHQATPDDPYYINGSMWGMLGDTTAPANQFGSQAGKAWRAENVGSASIYVGVIDEGIDLNHPDLASNIWTNPFDPVDGVDNDGNGYVDDVHGWDFSQNNNSIYDGSPSDSTTDSHGTHVSGIIGAVGGNGIGVAGVNWNVTMISAKFLGPSGGTTADAISAIDYITDLKTRHGLNIVATNNSWGGGGYSQALHDAIIRAANAGILFVAAAGNGNFFGLGLNNDTTPYYPSNYNTAAGTPTQPAASYDAVIAVASITSTGEKASFSNYGKTTVDLGAPGSGIWSTTPNNGYRSFSGTSTAAPHVTGAAALYASLNPLATASDIKSALLAAAVATPTASLDNITVTNGRLNIGYFAGPPPPPLPPNPPGDLSAVAASSSQIDLTWADHSSDEDGFEIQRCEGAGCTNFTVIASMGVNLVTYSTTGLSANTLYRYRVRAFNGGGASGYSNEAEVTTQPAPGPPALRLSES